MDKIATLRQAIKQKTGELSAHVEDAAEFQRRVDEIESDKATLARLEKAEALNAATAVRIGEGDGATVDTVDPAVARLAETRALSRGPSSLAEAYSTKGRSFLDKFERNAAVARAENGIRVDPSKHFRSFGEQLQAVFTAASSRGMTVDPRLVRAPTGAGEVDPTGGGFLVQTDFGNAVWMIAHELGDLLSRVNKLPIGPQFNGIKIPGVDETSRATGSRWGGVQSYWVDEGTSVTTTKPKFRIIEFSLKKLMSAMYMSDELLQDSTALTSIASQAFSEEIMFMTEDAIWEGTGVGQPTGIMKSNALITVGAENGQKSGTIVKENLDKMWSRCWNRSRKNAVWLINQDVEPQLFSLNQAVGTGGQPLYMPPGGLSEAPFGTLYGRPVIPTEYNAALGTSGDIALVDLSQYTLADKGGVNAATSMHVAFLTDQMVFRITYRVDGQPMWTAPLTRFKGGTQNSPFIALASR